MTKEAGAPAKASGENIEQFGYKQELRRGMGLWDVVLYGVLFMVIIAPQSIFGTIQQNSHGMTPLVYIIGFVAILFTAMSYMRMSKRFPIAGSVYSYVQRGINPHVGFMAGWLILLDYILVPSLLIVMVMNWGVALVPGSPAWLWAVAFIAFNTFVNIRGIQMSRGVDWVIFIVEIVAVVAFIALGTNFVLGGGGAGGFSGFGGDGVDLGDIFGDIFGGGFGGFGGSARQANPNAPRKGQDIRVRITLSFDEAVHGCKKNITITRQQECTECHGSGCAAGSSPETCPDCGGRGYVIRQQRTPFGVMQTQQPCSRCGGKGKLVKNPCKVCHGSGKTAARKTLEVSIPMGIDDDQSFALRGMGDAGANGGPAGDVIVMVTVRPSEVFQRDGYDVWVTVPITYSQAVLGDSITVPSIDGKVEYTVPEGTQSGTTFRLRGKGIQYLNGRGRGDMYVKCEVEIPKKLNKAQRDALKKFEGTLKEENYEKRKGFFKKLKDMFA